MSLIFLRHFYLPTINTPTINLSAEFSYTKFFLITFYDISNSLVFFPDLITVFGKDHFVILQSDIWEPDANLIVPFCIFYHLFPHLNVLTVHIRLQLFAFLLTRFRQSRICQKCIFRFQWVIQRSLHYLYTFLHSSLYLIGWGFINISFTEFFYFFMEFFELLF